MTAVPGASVREILIATDFSNEAEGALRVAVDYARRFGARLHLFHVFFPDEMDVTRLLADAAALAGPDVSVTIASAGGDPAEEILRYATLHAIDLVVVGTHGRSGVSRLLLGSVADRVLRGAACPVLAVPPRAVAHEGEPPAAGEAELEAPAPHRCLVCATPSPDLICEHCRARIRGEALYHKLREERAGRT